MRGGFDVLEIDAGVSIPTASVEEVDRNAWEKVRQVDLASTVNATRLAIPHPSNFSAGVIIDMPPVADRFGYANRSLYRTAGAACECVR